ncbi:hypothetical protein CLF_111864 [Clonorchis sinensis]|uniref:Uncharacterized protein n=1 Tax=Clonorchis sinensis TaxID=79923 RepID=G7YVG3_CLOSI|nr:hypothetical protein CLF_111864 [Clonorchis sinensis]
MKTGKCLNLAWQIGRLIFRPSFMLHQSILDQSFAPSILSVIVLIKDSNISFDTNALLPYNHEVRVIKLVGTVAATSPVPYETLDNQIQYFSCCLFLKLPYDGPHANLSSYFESNTMDITKNWSSPPNIERRNFGVARNKEEFSLTESRTSSSRSARESEFPVYRINACVYKPLSISPVISLNFQDTKVPAAFRFIFAVIFRRIIHFLCVTVAENFSPSTCDLGFCALNHNFLGSCETLSTEIVFRRTRTGLTTRYVCTDATSIGNVVEYRQLGCPT